MPAIIQPVLSRPPSPALLSASTSASASSSSDPAGPGNSGGLAEDAVFERDVEFAKDHLLTSAEALDLASAPVLAEVAVAVAQEASIDDILATTSSGLLISQLPSSHLSSPPSDSFDLSKSGTPKRAVPDSDTENSSQQNSHFTPYNYNSTPGLSLSPSTAGRNVDNSSIPLTPGTPASFADSSLSGKPKRKLSFISYADIINAERLGDTYSSVPPSSPRPGTSSPGHNPLDLLVNDAQDSPSPRTRSPLSSSLSARPSAPNSRSPSPRSRSPVQPMTMLSAPPPSSKAHPGTQAPAGSDGKTKPADSHTQSVSTDNRIGREEDGRSSGSQPKEDSASWDPFNIKALSQLDLGVFGGSHSAKAASEN